MRDGLVALGEFTLILGGIEFLLWAGSEALWKLGLWKLARNERKRSAL